MLCRRLRLSLVAIVGLIFAFGCDAIDVWHTPPNTDEQYDKGLVVFYPGSANLYIEALGFYYSMRDDGLDLAIEEMKWQKYLEHMYDPFTIQPRINEKAEVEAERIAEYIRAHPDSPVTLVSFSGGAVFAIRVAERLPEDTPVDRVVLMSPAVWRGTDLSRALDHITQGMISYWSPNELGPKIEAITLGLADSVFDEPACSYGFDMVDDRLLQPTWTPDMVPLNNNGEHLDYLINIQWLRKYFVPWIATERVNPT